jgi:Heterokaryon incompatibility protein (HET)
VALSYVWGGVKQVMLNKKTQKFLEREGAISVEGLKEPDGEYAHLRPELEGRVVPRTIRDAVQLCQLLDERYLWTDSMCILQDDDFQQNNGAWTNADKLVQIPKMDIIYGASLLTVIAACGTDSSAGLPGVHNSSTRTKQVVGKIGDQIFMSVAGDPMDEFWLSKWAERAWTFQEFLLSKRHLIFLPEQVVYHCSTLSWSEDHSIEFVEEPETVMAVPAWTRSYKLRPLQLPDALKWSDNVFFPAIFINDYTNSWLKNFLKRQLTVPSDILFAFDGALSASKRYIGEFHHGLPIKYFCESLQWLVGTDSMYTGGDRLPHQGLTQRREGFPSWSWTGWIWDVAKFEEFHTHYQGKTPAH